jgi:hypothetical protein
MTYKVERNCHLVAPSRNCCNIVEVILLHAAIHDSHPENFAALGGESCSSNPKQGNKNFFQIYQWTHCTLYQQTSDFEKQVNSYGRPQFSATSPTALKMVTVCFVETFVPTHKSTWRHNPEQQRHPHVRRNITTHIWTCNFKDIYDVVKLHSYIQLKETNLPHITVCVNHLMWNLHVRSLWFCDPRSLYCLGITLLRFSTWVHNITDTYQMTRPIHTMYNQSLCLP